MAAGLRRRLEVRGHGLVLRESRRVVFRQTVVSHKTRRHDPWQLRHFGPHPFHPFGRNHQRWQVRVGEVAVVRGIFFGAHGAGFTRVGVEQHGSLLHGAAVFDLFDLPADLVVNCLLHELEAVQVLDLAPRAEFVARFAHRHVGVAAEAAFLHVAVADADPGDDLVQLFGIRHGFL